MIYENIDEDNYLSQSEEILQTERCKEDGRLLVNDSLIPLFLLKQICQGRIYRFSMDAFVKKTLKAIWLKPAQN